MSYRIKNMWNKYEKILKENKQNNIWRTSHLFTYKYLKEKCFKIFLWIALVTNKKDLNVFKVNFFIIIIQKDLIPKSLVKN